VRIGIVPQTRSPIGQGGGGKQNKGIKNMNKAIINSNSVEIKPNRTAKSGRALKAVFGRWEGSALVTDRGALASRKDYGAVQGFKGAQLTTEYAKAQSEFNTLGQAALSAEVAEVASGRREMKKIFVDPKNGRVTLITAPADKAVKVVEALKGLPQEVQDKVLAALKMA